ncbi:hypothetical protein [Turicibacter sanguinis]|uniref:hypothetical protein n=1 Tax=Turicibacter sanguinis TaxID=154288 RepID=UPI0021D4CEC7|nr:hypothetical protein [Turicibacter sanguinis]MCU7197348.1 hypothetical protein [Turicibacter sanguinis]
MKKHQDEKAFKLQTDYEDFILYVKTICNAYIVAGGGLLTITLMMNLGNHLLLNFVSVGFILYLLKLVRLFKRERRVYKKQLKI